MTRLTLHPILQRLARKASPCIVQGCSCFKFSVDDYENLYCEGCRRALAIAQTFAPLGELLEAAKTIPTEAAQDLLEDPIGYRERANEGWVRIAHAAVHKLTDALERLGST